MPSLQDIHRYLAGVWRLMNGHRDGLNYLDISADGFWTSFWAIVVTLPVFMFWWATEIAEFGDAARQLSGRLSILTRLAISDITAWVLPLAAMIPITRLAGCSDRFVALVIGTNWGSALINWMLLPALFAVQFLPEFASAVLGLMMIGLYLVLAWRLYHSIIGGTPLQASGALAALLIVEILASVTLRDVLGLPVFGPDGA